MAKILSNEPNGEDLFESKSQENIAKSIIKEIGNLGLIGIEGSWGTGKSNLVKIIEKKLNKSSDSEGKKYSFFIYDAWGHQEDNHRRVLIEELVGYVEKNGISKCDELNALKEKKKEILGAVITTETKISSGFSWATFFLFCALVSTPITETFKFLLAGTACFRWAIPFLPLIFVSIAVGCAVKSSRKSGDFCNKFKDELIGAYKKGDTNQTKTEYTNTRNPSTESFKDFFAMLNEKITSGTTLFIVVDNLDRLSKDKVRDIWATVQTCFAGDNNYGSIKVIVPFDREHLQKNLLGEEERVDDYLNKTFDIVFRVAPPVLSDWESFFESKWQEAFGNIATAEDREEYDYVKRIYDAYTELITPRDIIAFINGCVAIDMMGIEGVKHRYVAIFVKKKVDILKDIVAALSNVDYLMPLEYLFSKDELFYKSIAALAYQVSLDKGMEVAIGRALRQALVNNNEEEVKRIAAINTFAFLLDDTLADINEPEEIFDSIRALKAVESDRFGGEEAFYIRWGMLLYKVQRVGSYSDSLEDYQKILLENVRKSDKERYVKYLLEGWRDNQISAVSLANNMDAIDSILSNTGINIWNMVDEYNVGWSQFEPFIKQRNEDINKYRITCDENEIDGKLSSCSLEQLEAVKYIPALINDGYELRAYTKKLQEFTRQQLDIKLCGILISRFKEVQDRNIFIGCLDNINVLANFVETAKHNSNFNGMLYDLLAIALVKFGFNDLQSYGAFTELLMDKRDELAKKVAKCIEYYMDCGDVLLRAKVMKASVLYQRVCQILVSEEFERMRYLSLETMVPAFETIALSTGINKNDLAKFLSQRNSDDIRNMDNTKVEQCISKSFLHYTNDIADNEFVSETRNRVLQYLKELSEGEWLKYLRQGIESYGISAGLLLRFKWTDAAMLAIKEFLEEAARNKTLPGNYGQWDELITSIKQTGRNLKQTFGNVYDQLKGRQISADEFKFWADWIFDAHVIEPVQSTLRRFIPEKLLEDKECLEIMLRHREEVKAIYLAAGEEQSDFKEHLQELIYMKRENDESNEIEDNLVDVASMLGIDIAEES